MGKTLWAATCVCGMAAAVVGLVVESFTARASAYPAPTERPRLEHAPPTMSLLPYSPRPSAYRAGISQNRFNAIIDAVAALYAYDYGIHGKDSLELDKDWDNPEANAEAWQGIMSDKRRWGIKIWGGLARVTGMTDDALALLVCHEFGHHFGGGNMGYTGQFQVRMQTEGGSDFYAAGTCTKNLWANTTEANRQARESAEQDPELAAGITACRAQYQEPRSQDICIRTAAAALTVATRYFHVYDQREETPPSLSRHDQSQPDITLGTEAYVEAYPSPQCRLDLFMAGALCPKVIPAKTIPGWDIYEESWPKSDLSVYQEDQAMLQYACLEGKHQPRPRCYWLKKQPPEERFIDF